MSEERKQTGDANKIWEVGTLQAQPFVPQGTVSAMQRTASTYMVKKVSSRCPEGVGLGEGNDTCFNLATAFGKCLGSRRSLT